MDRIHGAYIVARYSTDNQSETSIDEQVAVCSKYCEHNGLPVLDIFADMAVSGMKKSRPELERMMQCLRAGGADTVVIYDQSRMYRNSDYWFEIRHTLDQMGVRIASATQDYVGKDINEPDVFVMEHTMAILNQMHVLETRKRVLLDKKYKAQKGMHLGGKPALGYRKRDDGYLEIEPAEAEIVRMIFEMYAAGSSYAEVIRALNDRGYTTKRGQPFGKNSLHDLLKNQKYIGTVVSQQSAVSPDGKRNRHAPRAGGSTVVEGGCPAIVSKDTWDLVQARIAQNKHNKAGRPTTEPQPLKGKIFCGECGSAMHISYSWSRHTGSNHEYAYYACAAKKRHAADCKTAPIRKDLLEQTVAQIVRDEIASGSVDLRSYLIKQRDSIRGQASPGLRAAEKRLADINRKLDNAIDAVLDGLSSPALKQRIAALEADRDAMQRNIATLSAALTTADIDDDTIDYFVEELSAIGGMSDAAVLGLVVRVDVFADTIKVYTILDGPPDKQTGKIDKHDVGECIQVNQDSGADDIAQNYWCSIRRTMTYAQNQIIIVVAMPRPIRR